MSRTGYVVAEISQERTRQEREKGYGPTHDDRHTDGSIAEAAAALAANDLETWPWEDTTPAQLPYDFLKRPDLIAARRRQLVKAGALIVAEIERLDRLEVRHGD